MKIRLITLSLLLVASFFNAKAFTAKDIDRKTFYDAVKSGTLISVDKAIAALPSSGLKNTDAFEGTLLMKKAGLLSKPKDKLDFFKKGRAKLEEAIQKDNNNTEFRFMRLMIQEHTPRLVKYRDDLDNDAAFIEKNFRNLSPELQSIIFDYSKQSSTLKTSNLQ